MKTWLLLILVFLVHASSCKDLKGTFNLDTGSFNEQVRVDLKKIDLVSQAYGTIEVFMRITSGSCKGNKITICDHIGNALGKLTLSGNSSDHDFYSASISITAGSYDRLILKVSEQYSANDDKVSSSSGKFKMTVKNPDSDNRYENENIRKIHERDVICYEIFPESGINVIPERILHLDFTFFESGNIRIDRLFCDFLEK